MSRAGGGGGPGQPKHALLSWLPLCLECSGKATLCTGFHFAWRQRPSGCDGRCLRYKGTLDISAERLTEAVIVTEAGRLALRACQKATRE